MKLWFALKLGKPSCRRILSATPVEQSADVRTTLPVFRSGCSTPRRRCGPSPTPCKPGWSSEPRSLRRSFAVFHSHWGVRWAPDCFKDLSLDLALFPNFQSRPETGPLFSFHNPPNLCQGPMTSYLPDVFLTLICQVFRLCVIHSIPDIPKIS